MLHLIELDAEPVTERLRSSEGPARAAVTLCKKYLQMKHSKLRFCTQKSLKLKKPIHSPDLQYRS